MDSLGEEPLRLQGDAEYKKGNLQKALELYTKSLSVSTNQFEKGQTLGNRSQLLFDLGIFDKSLSDAEEAVSIAIALKDDEGKQQLRRDRALAEVKLQMYKLLTCHDSVASENYVGPVEVRVSMTKGRGLYATRHINAGEILLIARPLASCICEKNGGSIAEPHKVLEAQLLEAKKKDLGIQKMLEELTDGTSRTGENRNLFLQVKLNAFQVSTKSSSFALYHMPSFCNHSCAPNATMIFVSTLVVIVKAGRDIRANEEVSINYFPTLDMTYEQRQKRCAEWGFTCGCAYCELELNKLQGVDALYNQIQPKLGLLSRLFFDCVNKRSTHTDSIRKSYDRVLKEIDEWLMPRNLSEAESFMARWMFAGGYQIKRALSEYSGDVDEATKYQQLVLRMQEEMEPSSFEQCKTSWIAEQFALAAKLDSLEMRQQHCQKIISTRYGNDPRVKEVALKLVGAAVMESNSSEWTREL